ncbi:MAG: hypothetical protein IJH07_08575 [Ruminococcus sp.]|nr:hypothetical protein [Ruminococcus sp.]
MKRLIFIVLAIMSMIFAAVSAAGAQTVPFGTAGEDDFGTDNPADTDIIGDTDGDGDINILDVCLVQYVLAHIRLFDDAQQQRADVDLNGAVESIDVTYLQRWLVKTEGSPYIGMTVSDSLRWGRERQIMNEINSFTRSKGVDISVFNGDVDMEKLKAEGYDFVIIRLGYGDDEADQDDKMFETNVQKAEAAGLDWGAYIYSYALSENEAKSEVNHTLRLLRGKHPTMPIAFDWEDDSYKQRMGMPSDAEVLRIASTYVNGIYNAGYYPMIYTGYSWLKGAFNDDSLFEHCDIWLAQWSTQYDYHDRPLGMWQFGGETNFIETPYISGLSGVFDKDYSYKNYPLIIKAYGYNNHEPLLRSYVSTGAGYDDGIKAKSENLPPECNGVMGNSLRNGTIQ